MVLSMKEDEFDDPRMSPITALAMICIPGILTGRTILHDQLRDIIGDRADDFGDLRALIRPFYHVAKYAPWSIQTYSGKPFSTFPREEQEDAYRLLREHGCESLPREMFQRDHQAFLRAKAKEFRETSFQRWALAESVLNQVVAHLAACVRSAHGIGIESDPDGSDPEDEGVWDIGGRRPRRRAHLKLLQGGRR